MNVSLTPQLEAMIRRKVESGMYNNASEVVREALRLLDAHERRVDMPALDKFATAFENVAADELETEAAAAIAEVRAEYDRTPKP